MAMIVRNIAVLTKAGRKNVPLRRVLDAWLNVAEAATWKSLNDVRKTFPATDGVSVKGIGGVILVATVFNIKGNEYRLITGVNYQASVVYVYDVLTHAEYDKNHWKDRL